MIGCPLKRFPPASLTVSHCDDESCEFEIGIYGVHCVIQLRSLKDWLLETANLIEFPESSKRRHILT